MPLYFSPVGNDQTFDANGDPLTGGQIETYIADSSTPLATFTDDTGSTPQSNPIILNSLGYPTLGAVWLTGGQSYKFVIKDSLGATLRTIDNISGVNDASVSQSEWVVSGFTPTYINATSFSVPGDQTMVLQVNRRLRTTNTSGFIYSTITNSVFAAGITTVTVANDSGTLDAGLSVVEYGLLSATSPAIPVVPISLGGTGQTTALAAFDALKQAATTAYAGVSEFSTDAEAQAGTDPAKAVTPDNLGATVLGIGQSWQNVAGSRSQGVTYTNTTGRTIAVSVVGVVAASGSFLLVVAGSTFQAFNNAAGVATTSSVFAVVESGQTYSVSGATSISSWRELR